MKKNKAIAVLIAMCLITAMVFSGCGSTAAGPAGSSTGNQEETPLTETARKL